MSKPLEKKPEQAQQQQTEHSPKKAEPPKGKAHAPLPDTCHAVSCKTKPARFNFCDEHFDQFKFGLIKKTGLPVSDYEKKFEQYQAYKLRQRSAHKVA